MDQDETWHAGTPRPWPHCVTVYLAVEDWMWLGPRRFVTLVRSAVYKLSYLLILLTHIVLDGVPAPAKGAQQPPSFWPMSIVFTVARLSYC